MAGASSFFAHERETNALLCALRRACTGAGAGGEQTGVSSNGDLISLDDDDVAPAKSADGLLPSSSAGDLEAAVAFMLAHWERVLLLVPQSVSMEPPNNFLIDAAFVESHIAILGPPDTPYSDVFVTRDGIWGRLVARNQFIRLNKLQSEQYEPPFRLPLAPLPPLSDLSLTVFERATPASLREGESNPAEGDVYVLRHGSVEIGERVISIVLISEPLYYHGARWTRLDDLASSAPMDKVPVASNVISDALSGIASQIQSKTVAVSSAVGTSGAKTRTRLRDFLGQFGAGNEIDSENPLFPNDIAGDGQSEQLGNEGDGQGLEVPSSADTTPMLDSRAPSNFFQMLQRPEAADVTKLLRTFVTKFATVAKQQLTQQRLASMAVQAARIHRFIADVREQVLASHPLWKDTSTDDKTLEGLEKYLATKLYSVIFRAHAQADDVRPLTAEGIGADATLDRRLVQLRSFLTPAHLDLDEQAVSEPLMKLAVAELHKMNDYKAPRDKLVCILNCCKVAYRMLRGRDAGADEFLPMLIWIVVCARPAHLATNLEYIAAFRNEQKLHEEMGYYFTQLSSAATFVERCDASVLSIDAEEFAMQMVLNDPGDHLDLFPEEKVQSHARLQSWADVMALSKSHTQSNLNKFANATSASLSLADVPQLLSAYKLLLAENSDLRDRLRKH